MNHQTAFKFLIFASLLSIGNLIAASPSAENQGELRGTPIAAISLTEVHLGTPEIDLRLLESYGPVPSDVKAFFTAARKVFENRDEDIHFTHPAILKAAEEHQRFLLGGPLLGNLGPTHVSIWLRPARSETLHLVVKTTDGQTIKSMDIEAVHAGFVRRIELTGLSPSSTYQYTLASETTPLASGRFTTTPEADERGRFRIAFGGDFHKIGLHNPDLFEQMDARKPAALLLVGDSAADDRRENMNLHRSDYLLRDVSPAWSGFVANVPVYAIWDDHDYFDDDLSGLQNGLFTEADRKAIRKVWKTNWNNPPTPEGHEGINFKTRLGPVEIFMLDTRSCRDHGLRGKYTSFLGTAQQEWLLEALRTSTAPFKLLCSGTMWSDYVSNGKDSWTVWDKEALEEIFGLIKAEDIGGVLLLSGDRHGARGFRIPRPSGHRFLELGVGSLGGIHGPPGIVDAGEAQIFGYNGEGFTAFGELEFDMTTSKPVLTFRLISETGEILEEHQWTQEQLATEPQ